MASNGGPVYPVDGTQYYGMFVRDAFAKAIVIGEGIPVRIRGNVCTRLLESEQVAEVQEIYRYAQLLTDEKLRRDTADIEVHECQNSANECPRIWPDRGQGPFIVFTATSDDLHCELCEMAAQTIYICTRCQCIICHGCFLKRAHGKADRDEGKEG